MRGISFTAPLSKAAFSWATGRAVSDSRLPQRLPVAQGSASAGGESPARAHWPTYRKEAWGGRLGNPRVPSFATEHRPTLLGRVILFESRGKERVDGVDVRLARPLAFLTCFCRGYRTHANRVNRRSALARARRAFGSLGQEGCERRARVTTVVYRKEDGEKPLRVRGVLSTRPPSVGRRRSHVPRE